MSVAMVERRAEVALNDFAATIPQLSLDQVHHAKGGPDNGIDLIVDASLDGRQLRLLIEVKNMGQPRRVREAAYQLKRHIERSGEAGVPIFMAPFLSEQSQAVCREEGIGYLDFAGNARIASGPIFIERHVEGRPEPERRALRTLFKPKSARILRVLLNEPGRQWRVTELADEAQVSLGLVSTISSALRERDWAESDTQGFRLIDPDSLLDDWVREYESPKGEEVRLYTHLHGKALAERLGALRLEEGRVTAASFTAADWLAPFVRQGTSYFYADEKGLGALQTALSLSAPAKGANIVVRVPDEDGVLADARAVAPGIVATSPVQTYLDLMHAGERGIEGARHLREQLLQWQL